MKKRILAGLLAILLVISLIPVAFAAETEETKPVRQENECGDDLTWSYAEGVLTVTGSGEMDDYEEDAPWAVHKEKIEAVVLEGVTYIGARAFYDYDELESVDFGDQLKEIGTEAFRSCEGLEEIELPASFKVFGEGSFLGCVNLEKIHCQGNFPSFRLNSMWECYATIYYPAERPWSVSLIEELENAFHGRIEFIASDGTDHYVPTEETEAPTEEVTTEAPTEPPTEATTEPPTETTVPVTEAPTQAVTEPEETRELPPATEENTEQIPAETEDVIPQQVRKFNDRAVLLLMGIGLALTMIVALLLVIRKTAKKGKYSK